MSTPAKTGSRCFHYFSDWRNQLLECPRCGWQGTFYDGSVGCHRELMDSSCPSCPILHSPILASVLYPTFEEMCNNLDRPGVAERVRRIEEFSERFDALKLRRAAQLPDVGQPYFVLHWDISEKEGRSWTLIRLANRVLFSEPALWEGFERFPQVARILQERYGSRVLDLIPTQDSELYLYGDVSRAPEEVAEVRRRLFAASATPGQRPN